MTEGIKNIEERRTSAFRDWVLETPNPDQLYLPLTHMTIGKYAREIIFNEKITPRECEVFKEALTYCFWGRAGYRPGGQTTITEVLCPVCFIFQGELLERAKRVFPFDTGGFENSMYKDFLGKEFSREDFSISGDSSLPMRLINKIYPSTEDYIKGKFDVVANADDVSSRGDFEVQGYLNLISTKGKNTHDDRVGTLEVTFGDPIPLKDNLKAIIVPHTLVDPDLGAKWVKSLSDDGVEILAYEFSPKRPAYEYQALVEQKFTEYLKAEKLVV